MKRGCLLPGLIGAAAVLAGCGSSDHPESVALFCSRPSAAFVRAIEGGLTVGAGGSLGEAWYVVLPAELRNSADWPQWLVGAHIRGAGLAEGEDIAVWATSADARPISAVDESAREFSEWGAAAQPGSPARAVADELRASSEYEDVYDCVAR